MANHSDLLATIQANLQQAMERKMPREQTVKFELDGQVRACCLAKPITYADLLKSIRELFGHHALANLESIHCTFSRDDAIRLPITNDDDVQKVIQIAETNGASKLNFTLTRKKSLDHGRNRTEKSADHGDSVSDDGQIDDSRIDSPPPGTIVQNRRRTVPAPPVNKSNKSNDGGIFIPESRDEIYSSGSSSVVSRESSGSDNGSRRRLPTNDLLRRVRASSTVSGGSGLSSSSNSSRTSSSSGESFCAQCSCSGNSYKSPQTPSNWKLGRQLGQGAFGKVFLCYDVDTGIELAIKQIPIRGLNSETSREVKILECEINIYKQLNHERIVRYYGAARTDDYLQIFMEYMTGGSVREQIQNYGALTEQLTKKFTKQILEGLIYLHQNRFVHRDIKCANILRDISGNIKLGDFGTSTRLFAITNQNQRDSGTIGTAHWTAPEIIQGSVFGRKVDIWSLGCTVVEMLTTGPPWQDLQPIAAIFHIATCDKPQYKLPDNVSSSAREFIDSCLTKDYHRRPTADELIRHPFVLDVQTRSTAPHSHSHPHLNQPVNPSPPHSTVSLPSMITKTSTAPTKVTTTISSPSSSPPSSSVLF